MTFELPDTSGTGTTSTGADIPDTTPPAGGGNSSLDNGNANQPPVQAWDSLPKSWKKDYEPHWKGLPEPVRQYAHQRETEYEQGIRRYSEPATRWSKAVEPFQEVFSAHPDVDPVQLFQGLAQNHLALLQATPAERKELFQQLAQTYGVDFAQAAAGQPGAQAAADDFSPAQIKRLREMFGPMADTLNTITAERDTQNLKQTQHIVDKFFSDPKNEFINDVSPDMIELFKAKKVGSIEEAYELACMRNPAVKPKYLASLTKQAGVQPAAPGFEVKNAGGPASTGTPKSIDDTLKATAAKLYARS